MNFRHYTERCYGFSYREYKALVPFVVIVAALLVWKISVPSAVCFVSGALCSALTGYIGMKVATKANGKTAYAAMSGMNGALTVAFTGGSVMGMAVVGVGLLGVVAMYVLFGDPNVVTAFGFEPAPSPPPVGSGRSTPKPLTWETRAR